MPIKKKDWAKILQGLAQVAQIPYQVQQLKEAQARQEMADEASRLRLESLRRADRLAQVEEQDVSEASYQRRTGSTGKIGDVFPGVTPSPKKTAAQTARETIANARKRLTTPSPKPNNGTEYRPDLFEAAAQNPAVLLQAFANIPNFASAWRAAQDVGRVPSGKREERTLVPYDKLTPSERTSWQVRFDSAKNNWYNISNFNPETVDELGQKKPFPYQSPQQYYNAMLFQSAIDNILPEDPRIKTWENKGWINAK